MELPSDSISSQFSLTSGWWLFFINLSGNSPHSNTHHLFPASTDMVPLCNDINFDDFTFFRASLCLSLAETGRALTLNVTLSSKRLRCCKATQKWSLVFIDGEGLVCCHSCGALLLQCIIALPCSLPAPKETPCCLLRRRQSRRLWKWLLAIEQRPNIRQASIPLWGLAWVLARVHLSSSTMNENSCKNPMNDNGWYGKQKAYSAVRRQPRQNTTHNNQDMAKQNFISLWLPCTVSFPASDSVIYRLINCFSGRRKVPTVQKQASVSSA